MVLGGRTSHGMKLHRSGMTVGMNLGIARGKKDRRIGTNPGVGHQQQNASAGSGAQGVQSLVLSPLISEIFGGFSTNLTLETEISDAVDDVCSHFSADETVFHVSVAGLQCFRVESTFLHVSKLHGYQ